MKKHGRGSLQASIRNVQQRAIATKRSTSVHAVQAVFFLVAWTVTFGVFLAFMYASIQGPNGYVPMKETIESVSELDPTMTTERIESVKEFDAVSEQTSGERIPVTSSVRILSCDPFVSTDSAFSAVHSWSEARSAELRTLGDRCVLSNGSTLLTFTFNARVPFSSRAYLQQAVASLEEHGELQVHPFYCRTSPRATAAKIRESEQAIELSCVFVTDGVEIQRSIVLSDAFDIDLPASLSDSENAEDYRTGTGDSAREYCVSFYEDDEQHMSVLSAYGIGGTQTSICRLRNGSWVAADDQGRVFVVDEEGSVRKNTVINPGMFAEIIGTEGSAVDIAYEYGNDGYARASVIRVDMRTLTSEVLFSEEGPVVE